MNFIESRPVLVIVDLHKILIVNQHDCNMVVHDVEYQEEMWLRNGKSSIYQNL